MQTIELIRPRRGYPAGKRFTTTPAVAEILVARQYAKLVHSQSPTRRPVDPNPEPATPDPDATGPAKKKTAKKRASKKRTTKKRSAKK